MGAWHSPGSIFHIGHRAVKDLFEVPVQIQEKIDGSFFAFGVFPDDDIDHEVLKLRSKSSMIYPEAPPGMFKPAVDYVISIREKLKFGWQYRGETLAKPKHNALVYERVPKGNVVLFDILTDEETYLPYDELKSEANRLGFDVVPQLYTGNVSSPDQLRTLLDTVSILGGQKIEGIVIKPLTSVFGQDKKLLMAKFVSEAFKEVHRKTWGESNPTGKDILTLIGNAYGTQARWQKALQHLREAGQITDRPQDIGLLIKEVPADILKECEDEIKEELFKWAWPHIRRLVGRGVPEWYKGLLLTQQFEKELKDNNL